MNHTEIAEKLSTLSGRPIRYVDLSPEAFAAKLTEQVLSTAFARDVATFYEVAAGALEEMTGRYDEPVYVLSIKDGSLIRKIPRRQRTARAVRLAAALTRSVAEGR